MKGVVMTGLCAAALSLMLLAKADADCPEMPDNDGYPFTPAGMEGWLEIQQVECCCYNNSVSAENPSSPTGPFTGCPCPHGPGDWFYYLTSYARTFEGVAYEDLKNKRGASGALEYSLEPRDYTEAACHGPNTQVVRCIVLVSSYYCDFKCEDC